MNLADNLMSCFPWQITLQSDSGSTCNYPFIQPLPYASHSFFSFLSVKFTHGHILLNAFYATATLYT